MSEINTSFMKTPCPGQTALLIAACSGHAPFVSALLQHPDIDPNISDHRQISPLVTSILAGQSHVTRVLVQHDNTDVNMLDMLKTLIFLGGPTTP